MKIFFVSTVIIGILGLCWGIPNPEEYPNLLAGSFTDGNRFSTGNTLPLIGMPWGFNHWSPQTKDAGRMSGSWWFNGNDHQLTWLRCTHQPSPWIGDWGYFLFIPLYGHTERSPVQFWEPRGAILKPYLLDTVLSPHNLRVQLAPTDHGAMVQVTFPKASEQKYFCFSTLQWGDQGRTDIGGQYIAGRSTQVHSERMIVNRFSLYMRAESDDAIEVKNSDDMRCFKFENSAEIVTIRISTSLISAQQAMTAMRRELSNKGFEDVLHNAKSTWNRLMRRINVIDPGGYTAESSRHLTVFYTGLYRALTFPRKLQEVDENGKMVHYSPYDPSGGIHDGPLVTDNGFWDTYRTVYPLLSVGFPDELAEIVQGWLNAFSEGGWLPSWASPGYRNCMVGTFADVVVADAIVKNIKGFNIEQAVAAILKDAFEESPKFVGGAVGKEGLHEYDSRGYLPSDAGGEVVSRTVDYGFADFSTAQALSHLAETFYKSNSQVKQELTTKAQTLFKRSVRAFSSLFDEGRGLMVPKDRQGRFSPRFNPVEWGNGFTEGNSWHHSFPPYAISCAVDPSSTKTKGFDCNGGLISLHRSKEKLLQKLHQLVDSESNFHPGSYGQEIHEMTEMRAFAMGQYGHNNQPVHHILFLFSLLGEHEATQHYVRYVLDRAYGEDFYAGDEDNGEQGAWFVLSALGLYPVTPGLPSYVLSSPIFPHVRITRDDKDNENHLDIFAPGTNKETILYEKAEINNHALDGLVSDEELFGSSSALVFTMKTKSQEHDLNYLDIYELHHTTTTDLEKPRQKTVNKENHITGENTRDATLDEKDVSKLQEKIHILEEKLKAEVYSKERSRTIDRAQYNPEQEKVSPFIVDPIILVVVLGFVAACITAVIVDRIKKNRGSNAAGRRARPENGESQRQSSGVSSSHSEKGYLTQRNVKPGAVTV